MEINLRKLTISSLKTSTIINPWASFRNWNSRKLAIKKNIVLPTQTNYTKIFESQERK